MASVVRIDSAVVRRGATPILAGVTLHVAEGERWIVMGPNGAGKTTLLQIAAARLFPTSGSVEILGEELGAVDTAELRPRIGWASSTVAMELPEAETVEDVVMTGAWAIAGRWREQYFDADRTRAQRLLGDWGIAALADRRFGTLSEGERKRTLIARALMADPELLLLDEPAAGLDLGGREELVARLTALARDPDAPALVLVTHHVEEVPAGFTHGLLLRDGQVIASGALDAVLTDDALTACFGVALTVYPDGGRWFARTAAR